jgi:hypothetical protein
MELIDRIGAFLGLAAFLGLGVLALLYFQQGREVRRLRDWAGRAPERAEAAAAEAEAALAAQTSGEEAADEERGPSLGDRARTRWELWKGRLPSGLGERLPPPQYLGLIALAAVLIGVGVATGGFGLLGEEEGSTGDGKHVVPPSKIEVAVLNGTAQNPGETGVPGLAQALGDDVKEVGYKLGPVTDAGTPFPESVVMYQDGLEAEAQRLSDDVSKQLGRTGVEKMSGGVQDLAGDATVAIVIGQDDSEF